MLYLIDTANLDAIRTCCEYYPVAGVTTNPTIVSREMIVGLVVTPATG